MKPQKRKCSSDKLSEMPDEVLVHILSCMPTFDAVRTMLIRPFGNLWTLVPTLNFDIGGFLNKMGFVDKGFNVVRFNIFVRNVLMLHKRPSIDKFYLLFGEYYEDGREEAGDDIRMWLTFAFDKQAKEINISDVCFDFPNFTSQSLVTLELRYCQIFLQFPVNLRSLKKLILFHTYMREEAFQQLICGCPSLQELHIEQLPTTNKLRFTAPNIHKLSLVFMEVNDPDDLNWSLDVPNLKSLDLEIGYMPDVIAVSSIRDVYLKELDIYVGAGDHDEKQHRRFNIFLEKFSRSEVFQLSLNASEPFFHSVDDLHLLQIRWKRVVLGLKILCQECLLGVYLLMRSSKFLEELDIYIDPTLRV
ncbi:F-box/FBD/LRR-repeat protein At5g56420-like [Silene latifolia]|uniref:F-box/FBD/LRR-repeat protein At5g56420-like n=1 Tax=Silene latifolia TaxID=37657 RepID=UPI003D77A533